MLGRKDWLPARAEPLNYRAYQTQDSEGRENPFEAALEVTWRIHVEGRESYEFSERRGAPFWTIKGSRHGRRWFHVRVRASQGLLREVGVPCRVHPEKPEKIDIDWSAAYDEHQPAWEHLDHRSKAYSQRAEGPLGKLLAPVEYLGLGKVSEEEQAEVDREVGERIEREQTLPLNLQTEMDERTWIVTQDAQARRLHKKGKRLPATVTALHPPPPGSMVWTIALEVEGVGPVQHRQALNEAWAAQLQPGTGTTVLVDPAAPTVMTLGG